ncbi:Imm53 family immunity protein [Paenibacillus sp. HWE-109]
MVTLDNPGWCVSINLQETTLENKPFESLVKERFEHDKREQIAEIKKSR